MLIVIWNLTWIIIPAAVLAVGIGVGFGIRRLLKKRAAKKAARAAHQNAEAQAQQTRQNDRETSRFNAPLEQTASHQQQSAPSQAEQTSSEQNSNSKADFLRNLDNNFRYDISDFDIVSKDPENFKKWLYLKNELSTAEGENYEKIQAELANLNQTFKSKYGHEPITPPESDICASVIDENGKLVKDNRSYCFNGMESPHFAAAAQNYDPTLGGDINPTIMQVALKDGTKYTVSATTKDLFFAGVQDIYDACSTQNAKDFSVKLLFGEGEERTLSEQKCSSIDGLHEFLSSKTKTADQEPEIEL